MIFKKNLTACLLEVSRLINSAINKRQGDQRKHSFLEKKKMHKKEKRFIMNTQKYQDTVDWSHLLKKSLMENFIFCPVIYKYIYLYYRWREWLKKKWFNTAVWSCCWQILLCSISYFRIFIFDLVSQTVQTEGSYHLFSYKE